MAADFDFDPASSEENGYRLFAYLHELVTKNFGIKAIDKGARGEYNFFVDFTFGDSAGSAPQGNPMVHSEGARLVDENGEPLVLRGVNVEGWLIWTGHGWGGEFTSEQEIRDHLDATAGPSETQRFEQAVYANFLTEEDIRMMAELGFNGVRVLFNHEILEDDERPFEYKESGWKLLDELLSWGERHGVYIVPCLIAAAGGQSSWFLADPDKKLLWEDPEAQRRTVALWRAIAERYRERSIIAGYDLLNEPKTRKPEELIDLYRRIISAIREVDPHHLVILEGTKSAMDFSMFDGPLDSNQMYSFHVYHLILRRLVKDASDELIDDMVALAERHQVPVWASEFGAHTAEWTEERLEHFEKAGTGLAGWAFWPWKRVPSKHSIEAYRHLAAIPAPDEWTRFINSVGKPLASRRVSRDEARSAMNAFIEAMKAENLEFDAEMKSLLSGKTKPKESQSRTAN